MFNTGELKLMQQSSKYKLQFPLILTQEEVHLKHKYEKLRKVKEKLNGYKATGSCNSPAKIIATSKATGLIKQTNSNSKKTTDFKNWSKQVQENVVKRSYPISCFKENSESRSIKIRGEGLTNEYLHKHFDKFGYIWKIRTNENKTSSILTFKQPESVVKSVEALHGSVIDGVKLEISVQRKNTSWSTANNNSSYLKHIKNRGRSVHLSYKGDLKVADFDEFFMKVGRIIRIYLNEAKHFGFAMFENAEQAERAITQMDGKICKGIKVSVSEQRFLDAAPTKTPFESVSQREEREIISYDDL